MEEMKKLTMYLATSLLMLATSMALATLPLYF